MESELTWEVIGCVIEVHKGLGAGLLESAYEKCLCHELKLNGINFEQQKPVSIKYKSLEVEAAFRVDLLIEGSLIVELKSVDKILPIHKAQLLSYLKLSNVKLGLIINFNVSKLTNGIVRLVY